jgi:hypothetical protein
LVDFVGNLHSRLVKRRILRDGGTSTIVSISPVILAVGAPAESVGETEGDLVTSLEGLSDYLNKLSAAEVPPQAVEEV